MCTLTVIILTISGLIMFRMCNSNPVFNDVMHLQRIPRGPSFWKHIRLPHVKQLFTGGLNNQEKGHHIMKIPNTSCGKIMCEKVKDYPEELIERLSSITLKTEKNLIGNSEDFADGFYNFMDIVPAAFDYPAEEISSASTSRMSKALPNTIIMQGIPHRKNYQPNEDLNPKRPNCNDQIKLIFPKEGLDTNNQSTYIVNNKNFKIVARECIAQKYCQDEHTPELKINKCRPNIVEKDLPVFNTITKEINFRKMKVHDGCKCESVYLKDID